MGKILQFCDVVLITKGNYELASFIFVHLLENFLPDVLPTVQKTPQFFQPFDQFIRNVRLILNFIL